MGYFRSSGSVLKKLILPILSLLCFFLVPISTSANSDLSISKVKDNCDIRDNIDGYHCLGYIVEQGFNQQKFAKEQIEFEPTGGGDNFVIKLNSPLVFRGDLDKDCSEDHPLCNDGIAFTMHGHSASKKIVIDTTNIQDDRCAIRIKAPYNDLLMIFTDFEVRSKQVNLFEEVSPDGNADAAICTERGEKIIIQDVTLNTDDSEGAVCGNGKVEEGEACDVGEQNGVPGSGCNTNCGKVNGDNDDDDDSCAQGPDYDGDGKADDRVECDDDIDGDGVPEGIDNCSARSIIPGANQTYFERIHNDPSLSEDEKRAQILSFANPASGDDGQPNMDGDAYGDHCDDDVDGDGIPNNDNGDQYPNVAPWNGQDNCWEDYNPDQANWNMDDEGDACDDETEPTDEDQDGVSDDDDNCPTVENPEQENQDGDDKGDACDPDIDGDGLPNDVEEADELCLSPTNEDSDGDGLLDGPGEDGLGEADPCPCVPDTACTDPDVDDVDHDGVSNDFDNCPNKPNGDQLDEDDDGVGDVCDPDIPDGDADEDGVLNIDDNCPTVANDQTDTDSDGLGDDCDPNPNVAEGGEIDADVEDAGSGCFNSLQPGSHTDMFSWLSLMLLAGALHLIRKFLSPY